jgi:hypothetical protein
MNNILRDFLEKNIGINNIKWEFSINSVTSRKNHELLNLLAFSFINIDEKRKLFQYLINNDLADFLSDELTNFFKNHYENILHQYQLKDDLQKEFVTNLLDWIIIVDNTISQKNISKILTYVHTKDIQFWIFLIKELYIRKLYNLCLIIIIKKKPKFKKDDLYEDLILYEIFSIKEAYDYLYSNTYIKRICDLSKEINSYATSKFFIQLECSLLNNNIHQFNNLFNSSIELINSFSTLELLYIFEFATLIKSEEAYNILNKRLLTFDIMEKENKYEYSLYSFYKEIYSRNFLKSISFIHRLAQEKYNFKHIVWYFEKNFYKDSFTLLYTIKEKNISLGNT